MPKGLLNPSHHTTMVHLHQHVFSKARNVSIYHTTLPDSVMPIGCLNPSQHTTMLHLRPYMIIEATTLSNSIVPHNHDTFMYVHSQWGQKVVLFHCITLPKCVYVHTHSIKPEGCLNPSHHTAILCLCSHIFIDTKMMSYTIAPICHAAFTFAHTQ